MTVKLQTSRRVVCSSSHLSGLVSGYNLADLQILEWINFQSLVHLKLIISFISTIIMFLMFFDYKARVCPNKIAKKILIIMVTIVSLYCCNKYSMFTLNMSNVKLIPRLEPSHHQASVVVSCCPIRDRDPWSRDTCWPISGGYPWTRQTNYQLSPWHPFISFPLQHTAAATAQLSFSSCQSVPVPVTARTLTLELMRPFQTGDAVTEPVF